MSQTEIPLPSDRFLLFDLDKTLIDPSYNVTDDAIVGEISRVQSLGWRLGLSSDTPLESLESWRKRFGMNGPIIAEKGSIVWLPDGTEITLSGAESFFGGLKQSLTKKLVDERIPFFYGDATRFIRDNPFLGGMVNNRLALIQAYRRCSMNFYGRKINDDGSLEIDNNLTQDLIGITKNLIDGSPFDLGEDYNPEYGIYILSPKEVNKRLGTTILMESLGLTQIGVVGDSASDIVGSDISIHYAVGNAREEFKKVADYIADDEYTRGVSEFLRRIKN